MTIMDKVNSTTRAAFQVLFDKEPVNYLEGANLFAITAQGRHNLSVLEVLYNQALDLDLKALIKNCINNLVIPVIKHCESLLASSNAHVPQFHYEEHKLHDSINIPSDARLTDEEIAMMLGAMAKVSQTALLIALHQSYQLEIGWVFRKYLDAGLDWNFRLLQLMLDRGWLPYLAKITH